MGIVWGNQIFLYGKVVGVTVFTTEDMKQAFGLTDDRPDEENWLLERFGGSVAQQGHYIRYGPFLNIQAPALDMTEIPTSLLRLIRKSKPPS